MVISFFKKHRALFTTLAVATLFALLSLSFIVFHAERGPMQIVGKVQSVQADRIIIDNARGEKTVLVANQNTPQALIDPKHPITEGTFVQAFGVRTESELFITERVRVVTDPIKNKR